MSDWNAKLKQAKEWLDAGFIKQEQFDKIQQQAIQSMMGTSTPTPTPEVDSLGTVVETPDSPSVEIPSDLDDMGTVVDDSRLVNLEPPTMLDGVGTFVGKMDGDVVGSHKIIELLGEGGMGSVYRGRHTIEAFAEAEGDVAIKMILPSLAKDEAFKNRFIREASLGKKLNHPNIAKVVSIHSSDDVLALVMEYIEGKELKDLIPEGGMSVDEVVQLLKPMASALDYLHEQGIVHRDMNPANVRVKPDGTPVILDFGIAKDTNEVDSNMTQTGTAMGTQTYMAPEQMDAKRVTGAADQYALAMMAYQMLSGRLPWDEGVSQARLGMIKLTSDYQTLIAMCSVSEPQNEAVMKGLSLQPEDRYETCVIFLETLELALSLEQLARDLFSVEQLEEDWFCREEYDALLVELDFEEDRLTEDARMVEESIPAEQASQKKEQERKLQEATERMSQQRAKILAENERKGNDETEDKNTLKPGEVSTIILETEEESNGFWKMAVGILLVCGFGYGVYAYLDSVEQASFQSRIDEISEDLRRFEIDVPRGRLGKSEVLSYETKVREQKALDERVSKLSDIADKFEIVKPEGYLDESTVSDFETKISAYTWEAGVTTVVPLGDFSINLKEASTLRILQMSISIECDRSAEVRINDKLQEIRNAILMFTSEYTVNSLSGLEGKMDLRDEIQLRINAIMKPDRIERIYFTKFIIGK